MDHETVLYYELYDYKFDYAIFNSYIRMFMFSNNDEESIRLKLKLVESVAVYYAWKNRN